jgi:dihydrolipoamide dehydrogenase
MPSKALLRPAQALAEARRVPGAAQAVDGRGVDVPAALARRDEVIHSLDDAVQLPWLEERGIRLFRGQGRFAGERTIAVGDDVVRARRAVVIAVGTAPLLPPVPGLRESAPWTNREATTSEAVPASLIVMGGGPVGVELAQAYASFGSSVTLVELAERILLREEEFAAREVREGLEACGVRVLEGVKATAVARGDDGRVSVETDGAGTLEADELLAASGRAFVSDSLGLESVGLSVDRGPLKVGDDLRVEGFDWLYVIGDANGRALLTHMGKYQGRLAADAILGDGPARARDANPPRVTFTEPQVAAVGHTLASALQAGLNARAVDVSTEGTAGASFHGKGAGGTSRIVVDEDARVIVGATFVGPDVAEWLHAATIAVVGAVTVDDLAHAVPAFPTRSEVWLKLLEAYGL